MLKEQTLSYTEHVVQRGRHHPELCVEAKDKQANKDARQKYPANMI